MVLALATAIAGLIIGFKGFVEARTAKSNPSNPMGEWM